MTISYLDKLNPQQRRAVEHGGDRVAGFRVVQLLPGAGPATAARVLDRVAEQSDPMRRLSEFTPPAAAAEYSVGPSPDHHGDAPSRQGAHD